MINALALLAALQSPQPIPTPQSLPVTVLAAPRATLRLQIARTPEEREVGLMGVAPLARHTGMIFVFESDEPVAFWMKDTLVPLDMVFISQSGVVRKIFADVPVVPPQLPDEKIPLEQAAAQYVIELPAGEAARDGLSPGTRIRGLPPIAVSPKPSD